MLRLKFIHTKKMPRTWFSAATFRTTPHTLSHLFYNLQNSVANASSAIHTILIQCGKTEAINAGKQAHAMMMKHGVCKDMNLMTSLLDMYSKCASIYSAHRVYDEMPEPDVVATNGMISGFCRFHLFSEAIDLFERMLERDVGSWNSLISGLGRNGEARTALFYFEKMRAEGVVKVDYVTMLSVLAVCTNLAALVSGRNVHGQAIKCGFDCLLPVGNALIDMYAKSGRMDDACLCFEDMPFKNVVSWTCLIMGYGKHGLGYEALRAFDQMENEHTLPNKITFLGILYACSHAGLVQEGRRMYNTMIHKYSIQPMMEHYTSMVDLLARAGHLNDAHKFIEMMPVKPDAKLLTAFLSSCCSHKHLELARGVGDQLLELDEPKEAGAYMLLSNFYGLVGDLDGVVKVRKLMLDSGIKKKKACTCIEINRAVHRFESNDRTHVGSEHIYAYLQTLTEKLKQIGYVPNTSMVMQNVDEGMKEEIVLAHSEKLAIAFGLISAAPGTTLTIVKNLRVCIDCHTFTCLVSKIERREIVARDSNRFHHFKDGVCSCGNYW